VRQLGVTLRDPRLVDLNFRKLLHYGGQPPVKYEYPTPIPCTGYCVSCEEKGVLAKAGGKLDLMSHGCDSQDFTSVLGRMPREGPVVSAAFLFVLEKPGGDWESGAEVPWRGFRKQPPNKHYYWSPHPGTWPRSIREFRGNFYGPYFAYLMRKHGLQNVYITNTVKCKWTPGRDESPIIDHCSRLFLKREVTLFAPRLAFCFGTNARVNSMRVLPPAARCSVTELYHPNYIKQKCRFHHRTPQECVTINDRRIRKALRGLS
jgi:hypothetical protein